MTKWDFFKSGWRPLLGWISLIIVFAAFIIHPLLLWVIAFFKLGIVAPIIDPIAILNIVGLIVGVGVMRTIEKVNGVPDSYDRYDRIERYSSRANRPSNSRRPNLREEERNSRPDLDSNETNEYMF